ncbi:MAG: hypothetical protein JNL11_16055 [Bdellovibrionaceae bacterium]|nr:hypothetical protein [Pseudobdellovibrionaceae bacterium]
MKRISKVFVASAQLALAASFISLTAYAIDKRGDRQIKAVYGKDDRLEVFQVSSPALLSIAASTAAMIPVSLLR